MSLYKIIKYTIVTPLFLICLPFAIIMFLIHARTFGEFIEDLLTATFDFYN